MLHHLHNYPHLPIPFLIALNLASFLICAKLWQQTLQINATIYVYPSPGSPGSGEKPFLNGFFLKKFYSFVFCLNPQLS